MQRIPSRHHAAALALAAAVGMAWLAASPPAYAQRSSEIHARMDDIAQRIDRREERGRLSRQDARRLRTELQSIRDAEDRMRRDGRLDDRERQILDRRLNRLRAHLEDDTKR